MNQTQYTTLFEALAVIPDPRKARGQRYAWALVLTLLAAGLASGQQNIRAIAQWVNLHAATLRAALPTLTSLPSESTLLRTARQIDVGILETAIAQLTQPHTDAEEEAGQMVTPCGTILQAQAVDGKTLRGTTACGMSTHLVSLVQHGCGTTLAQDQVANKRNEITAVPALLAGRDLTDTVVTMDALLTQRALAQQIVDQGGHYLMMVKKNQQRLWEDLDMYFQLPPIPADGEEWDRIQTIEKGHGRIEVRTLECGSGMGPDLDWPGAQQIIRRTTERTCIKTGKRSVQVVYGITSLNVTDVTAAHLETLWRGHWTIENRKHHVRDVTFGEDAGQAYRGNTPQVLAAFRNSIIDRFRQQSWTNMADAIRHYSASVPPCAGADRLAPRTTLT